MQQQSQAKNLTQSNSYTAAGRQNNIYTQTQQNTNGNGDGRIKFKVNSVEFLNDAEAAEFQELLAGLKGTGYVMVSGFASEEGDADANLALSEKRANHIAAMIRKQYPGVKVVASGSGEVKGNREWNRAVVVTSYPGFIWDPGIPNVTPTPPVVSESYSVRPTYHNGLNRTGRRGEFMFYSEYAYELGDDAVPFESWDGSDGNWLTSDRKNWTERWQTAAETITRRQLQNRLRPFQEVKDYYVWVQDQMDAVGHEIRWLRGALYLVDELQDTYDEGLIVLGAVFEKSMRPLLERLNVEIANFAITQFNRLLFGDLSGRPLRGEAAYQFDRQFIIQEQGPVAFEVYNDFAGTTALTNINNMFNKNTAWYALGGALVSDPIPTFPGMMESDLTDPTIRYGQQARIDVPTAMLYPERYGPDAGSRIFGQRLDQDEWIGENRWQWNAVPGAYQSVNRTIMGRSIDHYR